MPYHDSNVDAAPAGTDASFSLDRGRTARQGCLRQQRGRGVLSVSILGAWLPTGSSPRCMVLSLATTTRPDDIFKGSDCSFPVRTILRDRKHLPVVSSGKKSTAVDPTPDANPNPNFIHTEKSRRVTNYCHAKILY